MKDPKLDKQNKQLRASDIFFSNEMLYTHDYRCLKPDSHKDPKKWHAYEVEGYRKASTPVQLEDVQTFPYNNYMYNFEDPKNLRAVTKSSKSARKWWRKAHGIYYATTIPAVMKSNFFMNVTVCTEKCIEMENSKFANECHKKGGYFKCCVSDSNVGKISTVRPKLIKSGLVYDSPESLCKRNLKKDPCHWCLLDGICTIRDPMTGLLSHMFYPEEEIRTLDKPKSNDFNHEQVVYDNFEIPATVIFSERI